MIINVLAAVAAGIAAGVLVWAVQTRLAAAVRTMRARYTPTLECATFDPAAANLIVYLNCDRCARRTPHEDDQHNTATCVDCGTTRPSGEVTR